MLLHGKGGQIYVLCNDHSKKEKWKKAYSGKV